jgi:hypothetical protein
MAITCPHCDAIHPKMPWRAVMVCPACGQRFSPLAPDLPPVAEQVRRDRKRSDRALFILACLGVLGALTVGAAVPAFALVALVGLFALIARAGAGREETHPVIRLFVGVLAVGGVLVLVALAALAYLFVQCALGHGGFN